MTTPTEQPEALRLADALAYCDNHVASRAATELRRLEAAREADREAMRMAWQALRNLHALVWGECPSLLNEDSGGNSALDMDAKDAIKALEQRVGE